MPNLQLANVSLAFGPRVILKNVSLRLSDTSRAALCGINGSGKSTLLKIIAGETAPDTGETALSKNARISYLPQSVQPEISRPLLEDIFLSFSLPKDDEEIDNKWQREKAADIVLTGLGFSKNDYEKETGAFSSGWKMRIALAKVLLQKSDFLLLDEPTNYLDIEARVWLLKFLRNFEGGFLLVSHDRFFLDNAINEVYDLFQGNLRKFPGNYSHYEKQRAAELEELLKRYALQQIEIQKNEDLIRRFRYKASKAAMAQERIKKLEKMERIEIPENLKKISITFPPPPHSGNIAFFAEKTNKSYGNKKVINNLDLQIDSGEKLAVCGRNGAGKSTLLRILGGQDAEYEGTVKLGHGISPGYFSVENSEGLTGTESVLQFMEKDAPLSLLPKIRDMLGAFLFRGDDVYKPLNVLSGGEKSRLALLKMLTRPLNLLILDEPTNHLDIWTKDILLDALLKFSGTIILVCHDREFLEKLSTKTLYLDDGKHTLYYGSYNYFLEKTSGGQTEELQNNYKTHSEIKQNITRERREEIKKSQAEYKRKKKREDELVAKIEALEIEIRNAEENLAKPEVYTNGEKAKQAELKLRALQALLSEAQTEWESGF